MSLLESNSLQWKGNLAVVRIAGVCAGRELTVLIVVMHSASDFTEYNPIQINIKTSKQIPCIFLITVTSDTEKCIVNLF